MKGIVFNNERLVTEESHQCSVETKIKKLNLYNYLTAIFKTDANTYSFALLMAEASGQEDTAERVFKQMQTAVELYSDGMIQEETAIDYLELYQKIFIESKGTQSLSKEESDAASKPKKVVGNAKSRIESSGNSDQFLSEDLNAIFSTCRAVQYTRMNFYSILAHLNAKYKPLRAANTLMGMQQGGGHESNAITHFIRKLKNTEEGYRTSVSKRKNAEAIMNIRKKSAEDYDCRIARGEKINEKGVGTVKGAYRNAQRDYLTSLDNEKASLDTLDSVMACIKLQYQLTEATASNASKAPKQSDFTMSGTSAADQRTEASNDILQRQPSASMADSTSLNHPGVIPAIPLATAIDPPKTPAEKLEAIEILRGKLISEKLESEDDVSTTLQERTKALGDMQKAQETLEKAKEVYRSTDHAHSQASDKHNQILEREKQAAELHAQLLKEVRATGKRQRID